MSVHLTLLMYCPSTLLTTIYIVDITKQLAGDGTGEGLVSAYYQTVGWPTFLPTAEQTMFAGKVRSRLQLRQQHVQQRP
jgi:hypothetical protein